jgi:hypothetical protein
MINTTGVAYFSPANIFNTKDLLVQDTLDNITLDGAGRYSTIAVNRKDYGQFKRDNVYMEIGVSMPNTAALVDADQIEIYVQSGVEVDLSNIIVSPTDIPALSSNNDVWLNKQLTSTTRAEHISNIKPNDFGNKVIISKNSFEYQPDTTFFAQKFISFPLYNTSVADGKNTTFDDYYSIAIKPLAAFIANANVSVFVRFWHFKIPASDIGKLLEM